MCFEAVRVELPFDSTLLQELHQLAQGEFCYLSAYVDKHKVHCPLIKTYYYDYYLRLIKCLLYIRLYTHMYRTECFIR